MDKRSEKKIVKLTNKVVQSILDQSLSLYEVDSGYIQEINSLIEKKEYRALYHILTLFIDSTYLNVFNELETEGNQNHDIDMSILTDENNNNYFFDNGANGFSTPQLNIGRWMSKIKKCLS